MKIIMLKPKEVEEVYKIKTGTFANWRNQGRGPAYIKYGRKILYAIEEMEKFCQINRILTADSEYNFPQVDAQIHVFDRGLSVHTVQS